MTLENICTSLDLSKQLKETGYPQESLFWWEYYHLDGIREPHIVNDEEKLVGISNPPAKYYEFIAAPTASEIGEKLPEVIKNWKLLDAYPYGSFCRLTTEKMDEGEWWVSYKLYPIKDSLVTRSDKSEANARAKMWLYLKKEGLL